MEEEGFDYTGAYFLKSHITVAQYIVTWTILDLCKETMRRSRTWVTGIQWEQEGLDLAGARVAAVAAVDGEG